MRIRVRHTYDFGPARAVVGDDLVQARAWDAARSLPGAFALPQERAEWERAAALPELDARARDIAEIARFLAARRLCSHGVGTALLELNLARRLPEVQLVCTDYAPRTVERLAGLFPEAEVLQKDLTGDLPDADLHLMHRLDAELDDDEWRDVFARLPRPIVFVPNVVLDLAGAAREVARRVVRHRRLTNAGWFRNEAALRSLWNATHSDERRQIGDAGAYVLEPRR